MSMPPQPIEALREHLSQAHCSARFLAGPTGSVSIAGLLRGSSLGPRRRELTGRSVLLTTRDQLAAALALVELDGAAARIILCPPEITAGQFPALIERGGVDAIVSDYELPGQAAPEALLHDALLHGDLLHVRCGLPVTPCDALAQAAVRSTEWVLLTSGTTSEPKMIVHSLASLTAPMRSAANSETPVVWGTFYDIRRYGGLQIFLRALLQNGSLVLSSDDETGGAHLVRLGRHAVTHLTGTPSHWRRALMSPEARSIAPRYVRLSGEIADQPILNALHSVYPCASLSHAFASTEAGVAFEVNDGLAGFPASLLGRPGDVEMKVQNHSLLIRSNRVASRYLYPESLALRDSEGFVDTGDIVEPSGDRYYFLGRRNGVINVGGFKVYPEEVEAVINRHPSVRMSLVRPRRNSLTGSLVAADVLLKEACDAGGDARSSARISIEILEICRQSLAPHKVPATLRCVASLEVALAGKLVRDRA